VSESTVASNINLNVPADAHERAMALDPTRSFAVTAPAGSGKTGLLTQRVLKLLALCNSPEEVVCITFTRKAAAEMQERIVHALQLAAHQPRPSNPHEQLSWDLASAVLARDKAMNWHLLRNANRLRTQTIDGLCRALTQHNPLASGMGGNAKLLDQPVFAYRQAVENTLKHLEAEPNKNSTEPESSSPSLRHDLAALLNHMDNNLDSVSNLLVGLLAKRDQWLLPLLQARFATRDYLESVVAELNIETLEEITELLLPLASDLAQMADYAGNNCLTDKPDSSLCQLAEMTGLPEIDSNDLPLWRAFSDLMLTKPGEWRSPKGLTKACGFPAGDKESKGLCKERKMQMIELLGALQEIPKLKDLLNFVRSLPPQHYSHQQWRLLDSLTRILPTAAAELKLVFRQFNASDFTEITQGALQALGHEDDPTELALVLDYQIKHILVDEFQDTSSPQLQLLQKLTAGWETGDGRTLFIVGDGMQSCYGFRDANVGIFLDARSHGVGSVALTPLDLTVNFRSQAGVVNWVNEAFVQAFPDSDDIARGAVTYADSIAFKPDLGGAAVQIHALVDAEDRRNEAEQVCQLVSDCLANSEHDRVAILVRSRPHLSEIIPALQAAGIRWQATDIDPLASRMAIVDLLTLTRALHDPSDRNAWLALLRTPWCGLDMHDLHVIAGLQVEDDRGHFPHLLQRLAGFNQLPGLSTAGRSALARFVPVINNSWQNRRRKPLAYWIQGTWIALGGPTCLTASADYANAEDFFRLLQKYDQGGHISDWQEFDRAMGQLYAKPAEDADPRVQVMTIHKSKGLEFETVIIPGLDKGSRADEHQLLIWQERINRDGDKRLLLGPLSATGDDTDRLYQFLRDEQKIKGQLEITRLLYVGCTRAIKELHLLANLSRDEKKGGLKKPSSGSLISSLWPAVQDSVNEINSNPTSSTQAIEELAFIRRLKSDWQRPVMVPSSLLAAYRGRDNDGEEDNLPSDDRYRHRHARHTGTLLHRALQQVTQDGLTRWDANRISRQRQVWSLQLRQDGFDSASLAPALDKIELGLRRMLEDETGRWILSPDHAHSQCEASFWQELKNNRYNQASESIIDRTFVATAPQHLQAQHGQLDNQNKRWVIDYKSSEPSANQSLTAFIEHEVGEYSQQLQRYKALFLQQPSLAKAPVICTALYFPLIKHLEIVDFGDMQ